MDACSRASNSHESVVPRALPDEALARSLFALRPRFLTSD
jgi:hypothetical protein